MEIKHCRAVLLAICLGWLALMPGLAQTTFTTNRLGLVQQYYGSAT